MEVVPRSDNAERYLVAGRNGECGGEDEELLVGHVMEGAQEDNGQGHEKEHNLKGRGRNVAGGGAGGGAYHTHTIHTTLHRQHIHAYTHT